MAASAVALASMPMAVAPVPGAAGEFAVAGVLDAIRRRSGSHDGLRVACGVADRKQAKAGRGLRKSSDMALHGRFPL
jgi:hypothetical protein